MESTISAVFVVVLTAISIVFYFYYSSFTKAILCLLAVGAACYGIFSVWPSLEAVLLFLIVVFSIFQMMQAIANIKRQNRWPYLLGIIAVDRFLMLSVPSFWTQLPWGIRVGWTYGAIAIAVYLFFRFVIRAAIRKIFLRR